MSYIKVTDGLPTAGEEVFTYNGETEFKNVHDGVDWKFQLKYPITHWIPKPKKPNFDEVVEVREQMESEKATSL